MVEWLLVGMLIGILCSWRYRQVTRTQAVIEIAIMTETLQTRMKRWGTYWSAVVAHQMPLLDEEADEVIEETHAVFQEVIDLARRML